MRKGMIWLIISTFLLLAHQVLIVDRAFSFGNAYVSEDSQYIHVGNDYLDIVFQKSDGELYGIKQKSTNTDFIQEKNAYWALYTFLYYSNDQPKYVYGGLSRSFSYSSRSLNDGIALDLYWSDFLVDGIPLNARVGVTIEVKNSSQLSYWTITITNNESITIEAVYFPMISGLGQISVNPEQDYLIYPSMSGLVFQNPLSNFAQDRGWGWEMYYPSAWSTMQFMAYYGLQPAAGLYIATYDGGGSSKFFNFSKSNPSWAVAQVAHIPEFVPGAEYRMGYPTVVGVFSGDWYDAAQLYRTWALGQTWASQGPLATRSDIPHWYSSAGLRQWIYTNANCILNSNPYSIVPEVINDTSSFIGHPAIAAWIGWERQGWYAEYPDVFPPKEGWDAFRQTVTETHRLGNRVSFILGTTSYSSLAPSWSNAKPYAVIDRFGNYPYPYSFSECGRTVTLYRMCPATSFWEDTLKSMLSTLAQEGADIIQLDGFPVVGPSPCVDAGHSHPKGGGAWWQDNYQRIFGEFKTAARQINPDLILASEGMAETYMPLLDSFWDPFTTGWSPNSVKGSFANPLEVNLIPLWHAVYHDYAFLKSGISFFNGQAPNGAVGYGDYRDYYVRGFGLSLIWGEMPVAWDANEKISELDEQARNVADYLRRIVEARTGYAQPYLIYGRMLRPPVLNVPNFHIDGAKNIPYTGDEYPAFDTPSVLGSIWKAPSGDVGYIFTNISHDKVTFTLTISPSEILLPSTEYYTVIQNRNGSQSTLMLGVYLPQTLSIEINPLDVLLIKVATPASYFGTVQKTYIGYYQRPADPGGLIYWAGRLNASGGNLTDIIEAFANSTESQALYGTINSSNISTVVNDIYKALFGRDAETGGLNYYVNGFNSGQFTPATIMLNVLYGAQNEDLQSINNKLNAANLFTRTIDPELDGANFQVTYAGDSDAIAARSFLNSVTWDSATVPTQDETTAYIKTNIANPGDPILNP